MPERKRGSTVSMPGPLRAADTLDGIEIAVDAAQQVDQNFPLVLSKARQQSPLAFQRRDDDLVMGRAPLRGQRNRMGAAVIRRGPDRDQTAFLKQRQRA